MRHTLTLKSDIIPVNPRAVYNQGVEILTLSAAQSRPYFDQIITVYQAAFSQPPYNETLPDMLNFAARLPYHAVNQGFRCVVARPSTHAEITGFAYGYSGLPRTWWYGLVAPSLAEEEAAFWLNDYFELAELAVHPGWQGQGVGGLLHDALLRGLPYRTAALSTPQVETNAWHLYQRRGWVDLIEHFRFPGVPMVYRIMGLEL